MAYDKIDGYDGNIMGIWRDWDEAIVLNHQFSTEGCTINVTCHEKHHHLYHILSHRFGHFNNCQRVRHEKVLHLGGTPFWTNPKIPKCWLSAVTISYFVPYFTGLHPTGSPYHRGMPYRRGTQCSVSATSLQRHAAWQLLPWRGWMTWRLDDGVPPNHFFSRWIFPYKPSIFGVPPYMETPI